MDDRTPDRSTTGEGPGADDEARSAALAVIRARRRLTTHAVGTALVLAALTALWAVTEYHNAGGWPTGFRTGRRDHDWDPWIVYLWTVALAALAADALTVWRRRPVTEAEIRREIDRARA